MSNINRTYRCGGTLWEGRFRSCLAQEDVYLLVCQCYIELNLVRASMVPHPAEYHWSSHGAHARRDEDALLTPHSLYLALDSTPEACQAAYRELFQCALEAGLVDEIREANNGLRLGRRKVRGPVAVALGRRVTPGKRGHPRRVPVPESGELKLAG